MHFSPFSFTTLFQTGLRGVFCAAFLGSLVPLTANEPFLNKPSGEWTEAEALQVLNDSPWARTITTTTQDFQCDFKHPAFSGLFSEKFAREADSITPTRPATDVKPDGAEYVVRLVSVKPMQAAVDRLLALDEHKWKAYGSGWRLWPGSLPTDMNERRYNPADEITISIVLKKAGPGGASFRDYAFPHKNVQGSGANVPACAAVRTANGVGQWLVSGPVMDEEWNRLTSITMSFASTYNGKPLVSHPNEKLEFRFVANQHVFEATFEVNVKDLFDGTETFLHIPESVDAATP